MPMERCSVQTPTPFCHSYLRARSGDKKGLPFAMWVRAQRHRSPFSSSGQPVPQSAVPSYPTPSLKSSSLLIPSQGHSADRRKLCTWDNFRCLLQRARDWQCSEVREQVCWVKVEFDYPLVLCSQTTPANSCWLSSKP